MANYVVFFIFLCYSFLSSVVNGGSCYNSIYSRTEYCWYGCCSISQSSFSDYPCCSLLTYTTTTEYYSYYDYNSDYYYSYYNYLHSSSISTGAIIGIVIGCLIAFGVVVTVIICVCNANRRATTQYGGQTINYPNTTVSHITTHNPQTYAYHTNVPQSQPTMYSPPSYNSVVNNPAYQSGHMPPSQHNPAYQPDHIATPQQNNAYLSPSQYSATNPTQQGTVLQSPASQNHSGTPSTGQYTDLDSRSEGHYYSSISETTAPSAPDISGNN